MLRFKRYSRLSKDVGWSRASDKLSYYICFEYYCKYQASQQRPCDIEPQQQHQCCHSVHLQAKHSMTAISVASAILARFSYRSLITCGPRMYVTKEPTKASSTTHLRRVHISLPSHQRKRRFRHGYVEEEAKGHRRRKEGNLGL